MKKNVSVFLFILLLLTSSAAQSTDDVLAKIGEQIVTVNDLNPPAQEAAAKLPQAIIQTRRGELDKLIAELLFAAEAVARKTTVEKLLELEVEKKVVNPTPEQTQAIYDANREAFGSETFSQVKNTIVNYVRRESAEQLAKSFAESLKIKHKFSPGADVNSPNLTPTDVLASVGAEKILAAKFNERLRPLEYNLRRAVFERIKPALDETIYSNLILFDARRQRIPPEELIKREVTDKLREPTEQEARKFYDAQKAQFENVSFEIAKTQILSYLAEDQRGKIENELSQKLRVQNKVQIFLAEPPAPVLQISAGSAPSKGSLTAPVQIIMFTDFQCPACARMHPLMSDIVQTYQGKVRFSVRNFPLVNTHENAFRAAQAAAAANAQGKFFEYIDVLYKNQKALDDASLKKYAVQIGLNAKQFDLDLNSGKFDNQIRQDIKDGNSYGIRATPTIYLNGIVLSSLTDDAVKSLINKAVAGK